jgi:hypothetical protein
MWRLDGPLEKQLKSARLELSLLEAWHALVYDNARKLASGHIKKSDLVFSMNYRRKVQIWPSPLF